MVELTDPFRVRFPDIERLIIDHLADYVPALRRCALVCQDWRKHSRPHLLRSISIKTGVQLEKLSTVLDENPTGIPRSSYIYSVTIAPTAKEWDLHRLVQHLPDTLFNAKTPNLRSLELSQTAKRSDTMNIITFQSATFDRLRSASIEELHLCSIRLGSRLDLLKVLIAFPRLSSLKCAGILFDAPADDVRVDALKDEARRCVVKLETLTLENVPQQFIFLVLEVVQDVLENLHMFRLKSIKGAYAIPLPPTLSSLPVLPKLSSLSLNWRTRPDTVLDDSLPEFLKAASGLTAGHFARWAPNLQKLTFQLHHNLLPYDEPRWSHKWYNSLLRRPVAAESMKAQYLGLQRASANLLPDKVYLVALNLSQWSQNPASILERSLRKHFDALNRKPESLLVQRGIIGTYGEMGHRGPVIALAVSPDGNWVASAGRDGYINLWDTEDPMAIAAQWMGLVDSSQSFGFSPDSQRIAFPTNAAGRFEFETFHIRRVDAPDDTPAALPDRETARPDGRSLRGRLSRRCAWSSDGSRLTTVVFRRGDSIPVFAYVWDTATNALLHTIKDSPSLVCPSPSPGPADLGPPLVDCAPDGDRLAVVWFPPVRLRDLGRSQRAPLFYTWNVTTGRRSALPDDDAGLPWSCIVVFARQDPQQATVFCGGTVGTWSLQGPAPSALKLKLDEHPSSLFSPDGRRRLTWGASRLKIWDTRADQRVAAFRCAHVVGGCFSPDGEHVAVCMEGGDGRAGLLQVGRVSDGALLGSFRYRCSSDIAGSTTAPSGRAIAFSGDGGAVYLGTPLGKVHVFQLHLGTERWQRDDD